jgi:hypothetical protein
VQEKISDSFSRTKAEYTTRIREYEISNLFRANNRLGIPAVQRTLPMTTVKSYSEGNSNITLDITLAVDTAEIISMN